MPFSVTIGSDTFEVYGGIAALTTYVNGMISDAAITWRELVPDDQARTLIGATRFIEEQVWQGTPTVPAVGGTALQWPRTGIVNPDGSALDPSTVPPAVLQAVFELAVMIADDPVVTSALDGGSNVQQIDAGGGVGIIYFNPTSSSFGSASNLPGILDRLVGKYLSIADSSDSVDSGYSGNGGCESKFDRDHDYKRWRPF